MKKFLIAVFQPINKIFDVLTPVGELIARCWVAYVFFKAGWLKLMSWDSTLTLFTYEFSVPILSPYYAAVLGTGFELLLPVLLVLGLGGRPTIFVFFMFNVIAVISYPVLFTPAGAEGLADHINWGLILMLLMFHGHGKLSLDYLLNRKFGYKFKASD